MSQTFDAVAEIIAEMGDLSIEEIKPESHVSDDLGIDSLDFFDIVFKVDKKFDIQIPLESWLEEVNQGDAPSEMYFVLANFCARVDQLIAAKVAA